LVVLGVFRRVVLFVVDESALRHRAQGS
jgi:hypothetical protein